MAVEAKRVFDLTVTGPLFVVSLPVQAAVALMVRKQLGSPVIFRQERPGLGGRPFELRKFRTMRPVDPARGWVDDASRLTPFGRWLRSTSLDELPTLWNVLRGDMSLVGPRPLLMHYLDRYTSEQVRRHEVRPGVTGLAQVRGRNGLAWDDKFAADVKYVDCRTVWLDLRILAATVAAVLWRDGISHSQAATMPEFAAASTPVTDSEADNQGEFRSGTNQAGIES